MSQPYKFTNICPIFISEDVKRTAKYYIGVLGFKYAEHFDKIDNFATVYRDSIEIVIVQKVNGKIESNKVKYGNGYDAYIDTATLEGIDNVYEEYMRKGVKIVSEPKLTDYGSYEFVFEDIDGRNIGIGLIKNKKEYFKKSNYLDT